MSVGLLFVIIGILMMAISAFWNPPRCSLWNLGWAVFLAGLVLFGGEKVSID